MVRDILIQYLLMVLFVHNGPICTIQRSIVLKTFVRPFLLYWYFGVQGLRFIQGEV
jgi:hypothetical protein